jgi:hypothetical protein
VKGNNGIKLNRNDVAIFVLVHVIIMISRATAGGRQVGVKTAFPVIGQ